MIQRSVILASMLLCLLFAGYAGASDCPESAGRLERSTWSSGILGQTMFYSVYLPPCYGSSRQPYPVIYLMHGSNEDDGHWQRLGLPVLLDQMITAQEIPPLVVVMPFGNVIANRNRFDRLSWGEIFREELMPAAEANYQIAVERSQRAIGGISRGGFWAYQIALSHPELFSAVGGHSAFFDPYHAEPADNPLDLVLNLPTDAPVRLWLDRGADDFAAPGLDLMHEQLLSRGVEHDYTIYPEGEHNNAYWSQHIESYIRFYTADWVSSPQVVAGPVTGFATNTPAAPLIPVNPTTAPDTSEKTLLPVAAFASLLTSVDSSLLDALLRGEFVAGLILDEQTAATLEARATAPHADILRVPDHLLRDTLRRQRDHFTLLALDRITPELRVLFVDDMPVTSLAGVYPLAGNDLNLLTRITFSGVTALARNTRIALDQHGIEWAASGISEYVSASDFFHISSEVSAVATCPQAPDGNYLGGANSMCARPEHLDLFELLGVDVVELTGNHNADYGYDPYRETLALYLERGYRITGGGETLEQARTPLRIEHNGNSVIILACNAAGPYYALVNEDPAGLGGVRPGAAFCDRDWLAQEIPLLAAASDVLIVSVQYVEVEDYLPLPDQQDFFRQLVAWGADVVLGSAAHKPQTFEWVPRAQDAPAWIHYGLGNLYFDQPFWGNMRFFFDTLYIYDGRLRSVELFPGIIENNGQPRLMTAEDRYNFLYFMFVEQNGF